MVRVTGVEPALACSQTIRKNFFQSFLMLFSHFRSVLLTLQASLNLRFPGVPALSVVIYVVKNASRPKPVIFHRPRTGSILRFRLVGL